MESKKIIEIINELTDSEKKYQKYFANTPNVEKYIEEQDVSKEDLLLIVNAMVNDDIFAWLDFIGSKLDIIAEDSVSFVNLMSSIIEKIKNDLAQGMFINSVIKLGEKNPDLTLKIYDRIVTRSRNDDTIAYAGFLLGGVGKIKEKEIKEYVLRIINRESYMIEDSLLLALVRASRVMLEGIKELDNIDFYEKIILKTSENHRNNRIKMESINLCLELFKFDKEKCFEKLMEIISKETNEALEFHLADRLWLFDLGDIEKEFDLIESLLKNKFESVYGKVGYFLAKKNTTNKDRSFSILSEIINSTQHFYPSELYYAVEEMFKSDLEFYNLKFINWINSETQREVVNAISKLILHVSSRNENLKESLNPILEIIDKRIHKLNEDAHKL